MKWLGIAVVLWIVGTSVTANAVTQGVSWTVAPPASTTVINANNPASATTLPDGYGATWSFDKTAALNAGCPRLQAPDCEGDWPVLRNGVSNNPPTVGNAKDPGSNYGAFQLKTVSGDPHMYAYDGRNFTWFRWNGSAWSAYGTAPPGEAGKTAVPILLGMGAWANGGFTPYNMAAAGMGRLPDDNQGQPTGIEGGCVLSSCWDPNMPNIPENDGYNIYMCAGPTTWFNCSAGIQMPTATGVAGNTYITLDPTTPMDATYLPYLNAVPVTYLPVNGAFSPTTLVTSVSSDRLTVNLSKPVLTSFTAGQVRIVPSVDWAGIGAGTWDSLIIPAIQSSLIPSANYMYWVRIAPEWCCQWEWHSPWAFTSSDFPIVGPSVWGPAVSHLAQLLKQYLVNCGVANGCNPNIKIGTDGPFDEQEASYLEYTDATHPVSAANAVDFFTTDGYAGANATGWDSLTAWTNYCCYNAGVPGRGYAVTFAQRYNKPTAWTEWADTSYAPGPVDGNIIKWFTNWFASVQGPGNSAFVWVGMSNTDQAGPVDLPSDYPAKQAAMAAPWPNGWGNTHYGGTYWPTKIPMPQKNPWDPTYSNHLPNGISLTPSSATVANTSPAGTGFSLAAFTTTDGQGISEGITTSDHNYFAVGTNADGYPDSPVVIKSYGLTLFQARAFSTADIGTHTTQVCAQAVPTVCTTFTLTIN